MGKYAASAKRAIFIIYLIFAHTLLFYLLVDKFILSRAVLPDWRPELSADPGLSSSPIPTPPSETTPAPSIELVTPFIEPPSRSRIIVPVAGVNPEQLIDTFMQARSEGRTHDAIDIAAPVGTPVYAAADGRIVKFYDSEKGGITIYQISTDEKYFFYYAHLQRRADALTEGQFVAAGTTIGYVGDTGNAGKGNFHLHFAISVAANPKRYWDGVNINPFDILRGNADLR